MPSKKEAYADYQAGLSPAKISEKYGVSINTVKSWIRRSKDKETDLPKGAPAPTAKAHPTGKDAHPHIMGAPVSKPMTSISKRRGAQVGNHNAERSGAFSRKYFRNISSEDQEMIDSLPLDEEAILQIQLKDLALKASYLKRKISELETKAGSYEITQINREHKEHGDSNSTMLRPVLDNIIRLEEELGRTHKQITSVVRTLTQYREGQARLWLERERLRIMEQKAAGCIPLEIEMEDVQDADVIVIDDASEGES